MMNMVKRFISTLALVVALVGTVSAQNLDDLSKKVLDLSFGVINKGINAYEEQLEKQELETAKKAEETAKKAEEAAKKAVEEAKKAVEEAKKAVEEAKKAVAEAKKAVAEAVVEAKKAVAEAEAEDEYWEAIDILNCCVFCDPINKDIFVKCYCYPIKDFVWYRAFLETDGKIWVNIFCDDNGEIGEILFASDMQKEESTNYTESVTGIKTPALKVTFTSGDLLFIQDTSDPYRFAISW